MSKKNCDTCALRHTCQMQPIKGCYVGKKDETMDEKIARRKELHKFYKKVAKLYN